MFFKEYLPTIFRFEMLTRKSLYQLPRAASVTVTEYFLGVGLLGICVARIDDSRP